MGQGRQPARIPAAGFPVDIIYSRNVPTTSASREDAEVEVTAATIPGQRYSSRIENLARGWQIRGHLGLREEQRSKEWKIEFVSIVGKLAPCVHEKTRR